jgi:predicted MFS family arabinose efflux permease
MTGLIIGRALIGFGVSACLMAAFKAFVMWFDRQQLPLINGFQMAAGGLGALTATAPVEAALSVTDWRGVFTILAILTLVVALLIFFVVPDRESAAEPEPLRDQLRGVGHVFSNLVFWQIAPWTVMSQATFLSIQGLWAGPWLRDVGGLSRAGVANTLFWVALAMVVGFISMGALTERFSRAGFKPMLVAGAGMLGFMVLQVLVILELTACVRPLWVLFGIFGTTGIIPYAILSQRFATHLTGRVNTAVNLMVFVAAFAAQWGIGSVINLWPVSPSGGYAPAGYRAAFSVMLFLQVAAFLWFWVAGRIISRRSVDHT